MKRRNFINTGIISGVGLTFSQCATAESKTKKRVLRVVHVTDMHIFPDAVPEQGIKNLIGRIHQLEDKPDFILNTGDNIMDSLKRTKDETAAQWDAWQRYFQSEIKFDLYNCIGNHDVWGWGIEDTSLLEDPLYGKEWAKGILGLESSWYSFNKNGWKFICLDSVSYARNSHAYTAELGDAQIDWLRNELKNTDSETPVCIASHIPVLSPSVFFDGENESTGNWEVPGAWMHIDARKIKDLFYQYPNVKAAISGHVHLVDKVDYLNVKYLCNGATCGGWWKGNYQEFAPAFAIIDFFDDGSLSSEIINYNWK